MNLDGRRGRPRRPVGIPDLRAGTPEGSESSPETAVTAMLQERFGNTQVLAGLHGGSDGLPGMIGAAIAGAIGGAGRSPVADEGPQNSAMLEALRGVRLHDDAQAHRRAAELGARAFTEGRDIYFAAGELRTGTREGVELLAHELHHALLGGGGPGLSDPNDPHERRAERFAADLVSGRGISPDILRPRSPSRGVSRAVETERPTDAHVQSRVDRLHERFEGVTVQVTLKVGKKGTVFRAPMQVRVNYRINANAGDRDAGALSSGISGRTQNPKKKAPPGGNAPGGTPLPTYTPEQQKALGADLSYARQGKATPEEFQRVIQAAIDLEKVPGLPVVLEEAHVVAPAGPVPQLNPAGEAFARASARASIASYARDSFGADCSGFAVQVASDLAGGEKEFTETFGMGGTEPRLNVGSQSGAGFPEVKDPVSFRPGMWVVTGGSPGHVRVLYGSSARTSADLPPEILTGMEARLGKGKVPAQLYEVTCAEQHSGRAYDPANSTAYYGAARSPADGKWGNEKVTYYAVPTIGRPKGAKKDDPPSVLGATWFRSNGTTVSVVSGVNVRDVPVGPPRREATP